MKRILILQTDGPPFLHATLRVLQKYFSGTEGLEIHLLVTGASLDALSVPAPSDVTIHRDPQSLRSLSFEIAVNFSLQEESWALMEKIQTPKRLGIYLEAGEVRVSDHWSTYLLTLKSPVPFLSFHLEEIFKNILGGRRAPPFAEDEFVLERFVFGLSPAQFFSAGEQEAFLNLLTKKFPGIAILDVSEVTDEDRAGSFYIGPPTTVTAVQEFPRNLFLEGRFRGTNLMPSTQAWVMTPGETGFTAGGVLETLLSLIENSSELPENISLFRLHYGDEEDSFIEQLRGEELTYPFYLTYHVLWNFVLGLTEREPAFPAVSEAQKEFLRPYLEVSKKISRFHSYALASLDILRSEAAKPRPETEVVEGHLENLRQIDETLRKLSDSHPLLRPLLDFYHIRRGQNDARGFKAQVENSLLTYHEEHQAFVAFQELLESLEQR